MAGSVCLMQFMIRHDLRECRITQLIKAKPMTLDSTPLVSCQQLMKTVT